MKFYILTDASEEETQGAYRTLAEAEEVGNDPMVFDGCYEIRVEEVEVTAENMALLLAGQGGYCKHMWRMEYRDGKCTSKRKAF
jgi:hypothetical protein